MARYAPTVVACHQCHPSVNHSLPTVVLNATNSLSEKINEEVFKATGFSPVLRHAVSKCDIIHAHFGPAGWLASHLAVQTQKPLVVTFHGSDITKRDLSLKQDGLMQKIFAITHPVLARRADKFICVSHYIRNRAIEFGFPEEKCVVSYTGIPLIPHAVPRQARDSNSTTPFRVLAVGRLVAIKGHEKLIAAVAQVQQAGYNVHLDIVGDGPLRASLEFQASSSLQSYRFHGGLPHDRVTAIMRQSDILCHSSISMPNGQAEAFGLVISEAQWAGLPVVAFASGGVPEALKHGETGLLCPEGDIKAMKDAICKLIDDRDLYQSMSHAAPDFIRKNFDGTFQTAKVEDIYDHILDRTRG